MENEHSSNYDHIGPWSEIKLEIIKKYVEAYSTILAKQNIFKHIYIDAFAGAGANISRTTGKMVLGSPLNALLVEPPFYEYHLVDHDGKKIDLLENAVDSCKYAERTKIYCGDCNKILIRDILPNVKREDYRRGLCLLDPYGLDIEWDVIATAGKLKTIDMLLNFPIMDINRNPLGRRPASKRTKAESRLNKLWGDDSWKEHFLQPQGNLFGEDDQVKKATNLQVLTAFRQRLKDVARFPHVTAPLPMKTPAGQIIYYLIFASQKAVATRIVSDIFAKHPT